VRRSSFSILRWVSLLFIVAAVLLTVFQLIRYSRIRSSFPPGMVIAGVPVGGMEPQQAADRLVQAYGVPVELRYDDAVIQVKPSTVGFELDLQGMLAAADLQRIDQPFWSAFWDYLWNRLPAPSEVPLSANISEERLRAFLTQEISPRYDVQPGAPLPIPGTTNFQPGDEGKTLDVDRAVVLIQDALRSPRSRIVNLTYNRVQANRPSMQNLQILLKQVIDVSGFDGITEVYLYDLQTNEEMQFAYSLGQDLQPDIAFTAASTMKIPIMVSVYRRTAEPTPADVVTAMELMIEQSGNDPADRLMEQVIDKNLGPLAISDDLKLLGLENTFLAGYFYPGAPLLIRYETPANLRTDVTTSPDLYNQTTTSDMGMLMHDIYLCSRNGGGTFGAAFPGEISRAECEQMLNYLSLNDIPVMIQGGLPEGTRVAHKHGWIIEYDGYQHMMGDAGIIYSPAGDYVLVMFFYDPVQIIFDPVNALAIDMSRAIYNYFNLGQ